MSSPLIYNIFQLVNSLHSMNGLFMVAAACNALVLNQINNVGVTVGPTPGRVTPLLEFADRLMNRLNLIFSLS